MKPPPPILPARGCVTAGANAVATAASTALPPRARIAAPASHAGDDVHTTRPSFDETPSSGPLRREGAATAIISVNSAIFFSMATAYSGTEIAKARRRMEIWPGEPFPLGAPYPGGGTIFSLSSEAASRLQLCLFDDASKETCVDLPEVTALCWHGYLPGIKPGQ